MIINIPFLVNNFPIYLIDEPESVAMNCVEFIKIELLHHFISDTQYIDEAPEFEIRVSRTHIGTGGVRGVDWVAGNDGRQVVLDESERPTKK